MCRTLKPISECELSIAHAIVNFLQLNFVLPERIEMPDLFFTSQLQCLLCSNHRRLQDYVIVVRAK
jgi:hypothetical protein